MLPDFYNQNIFLDEHLRLVGFDWAAGVDLPLISAMNEHLC